MIHYALNHHSPTTTDNWQLTDFLSQTLRNCSRWVMDLLNFWSWKINVEREGTLDLQ